MAVAALVRFSGFASGYSFGAACKKQVPTSRDNPIQADPIFCISGNLWAILAFSR
jgi:hypothetical protein